MNLEPATEAGHDFEASFAVARRILQTASALRLPLNPKVYRVLYEAECGPETSLHRLHAEIKALDRTPDVVDFEALHDRFFDGEAEHAGLTGIGERMLAEIDLVETLVADRIGHDRSFIGTLSSAQSRFGLFSRAADLKRSVAELVALSEQHMQRTAAFVTEIEGARREICDLQQELRELRDRINLDHLTGLYNRRYFDETLERAIGEALATQKPLAVALADLDHFKKVNDTWGHAVGDSLLRHFAAIIRGNIKGKDTAARYGGEEFALIFPDTVGRNARTVTESIRQGLFSRSFMATKSQQRIGQVSASFGVTELRDGDTAETLMARADSLLYEAKRRGRNNVASDVA